MKFSIIVLFVGLFQRCECQQQTSEYHKTNPLASTVTVLDPTSRPIALHQLIIVDAAGYALIRLKSYSRISPNMVYSINSLPNSGTLFQLSQVFSSYGYEPKTGSKISQVSTIVTGSDNRFIYSRPSPDQAGIDKWDVVSFTVSGPDGVSSLPGSLTLVPPSGAIVGSSFFLSSEGWSISGNKVASPASYEAFSRGALLSRYIVGGDDLVDVPGAGGSDLSLWYFEAPPKYFGNFGIAYGGQLSFSMGAFSGDFKALNAGSTNVVELLCASCTGPVTGGVRLGFPLAALLQASPGLLLGGSAQTLTLPLREDAGWLKDPQNTLLPWSAPSQCELIQVLSRLSGFRILGDWTAWYETVALDNVQISNLKAQLPLCSMTMPDASNGCSC
mmetsp:Transcript_23772/g.34033  ORF Transcript_23772/g.34033 Transcript_23772/m.34033 type:complete len:387 (+) Transcript_23772:25-1185(+)